MITGRSEITYINIIVVSSNPVHDEVYSTQHYVINFISDLRQVCGFPRILRFPPPIKLTEELIVIQVFYRKHAVAYNITMSFKDLEVKFI
jgi:hypothetical protein